MRGRKPKPTAKKRIEGNPGKRKLNKREPKPRMSTDIAPAQLDAAMRAFCDRYLPLLREMSVFTDVDQAAFEMMSLHYATAWRAAEMLQKSSLVIKDKFGQLHKHPALQLMRDNSALFRAYASEFGMTPSARSRIQVALPEEPSQLEMELFGEAMGVAK